MELIPMISGVITTIFLLFVLSYYVLLIIPLKKEQETKRFKSVTVIIPARNESPYIQRCVQAVLDATFPGKKQVIVINDASKDNTGDILKQFGKKIHVITNKKHSGKSFSINRALQKATGELIAIVDGDSIIEPDALGALAKILAQKNTAAACGVVKVENRTQFVNMWVHIELIYNSLIRGLFSKINANIVTPGALSMYRRKELKEIGGFSTKGFLEDVDIAIRLIRKGYKVQYAEDAVSWTNMPPETKGFLRQRTRFARGLINILKQHMALKTSIIDLYTLPLYLFMYVQAVVMGSITIYQLVDGYLTYFVAKEIYFSLGVVKFFFEWFSLVGFGKWAYSVLVGSTSWSLFSLVGVLSSLLSYPLFLYAIIRYDKRIDLLHIIPFVFMFPYWLFLMTVQLICLPEVLMKEQYNIWKKNE